MSCISFQKLRQQKISEKNDIISLIFLFHKPPPCPITSNPRACFFLRLMKNQNVFTYTLVTRKIHIQAKCNLFKTFTDKNV